MEIWSCLLIFSVLSVKEEAKLQTERRYQKFENREMCETLCTSGDLLEICDDEFKMRPDVFLQLCLAFKMQP